MRRRRVPGINTDLIRRNAIARGVLAVTTATVWITGDMAVRRAELDAAGYEGTRVTPELVRVSVILHREWSDALARGLPVPGWWRR